MSHAGEIDCFCKDSFPAPPSPPPLRRLALVAAGRRHRGGVIPTTFLVPEEVQQLWQLVAFFERMDTLIRW